MSMISTLISAEHGLGIEFEICQPFAGEQLKKAVTDAYIVDRAVAALATLKQCGTEQARQEYHIVLGALAPTIAAKGDREGLGKAVAGRLRVRRGRRPACTESAKQKREGIAQGSQLPAGRAAYVREFRCGNHTFIN